MGTTSFITGTHGQVYLGGIKGRLLEWTMNPNPTVDANTPVGSSGVRREYTGIVDYSGSFRFQFQKTTGSSGAVLEPIESMVKAGGTLAKVYAKFIQTTVSMWHGNVTFSGISKRQAGDGIQEWSGDWGADGRLTYATSTST